jgi:hypothetical protein
MNMAKDTTPPKPQTPWEKFTEAARIGFNLPKADVEKVKAKYPQNVTKRRPNKSTGSKRK